MTEKCGGDGAQMHGIAHGSRRAAITGNGLDRHGGSDMVLAHAAQLLRDEKTEKALLGQELEILPRVHELLVALDRIDAHVAGAEVDELSLQLLLVIAQHPLRIPFEAETPKRLLAPQLIRHGQPFPVLNFRSFQVHALCYGHEPILTSLRQFQTNLSKGSMGLRRLHAARQQPGFAGLFYRLAMPREANGDARPWRPAARRDAAQDYGEIR